MIIVNRQSIPQIKLIGKHKTPIIIIDDYATNLDEIVSQIIQKSCFKPDEVTNYPGIRSPIPKGLVVGYLKPLMKALYGIYKFPDTAEPAPKDNYFSLITTMPNDVSAMQSWPHFDTPNPNLIAVIHYLDKRSHGGTAFFKHKKSGLERIDNSNKDYFYQCADDYFQLKNTNTFSYCNEHHSEFSCYQKIEYKPNRLIVFPGQLLHSTLVDLNTDLDPNPASGRLTANMFVAFK